MGALQLSPLCAGTIRRVIRRGSTFICGLCRSTYSEEGEAQGCIQGCWTELLALDPVILKRRVLGVAYRCRFCARDYQSRNDATSCAEDCKAHQIALHDAEMSLTDQVEVPTKKRPGKAAAKLHAVRPAPVVAAPRPAASKKTVEAAAPAAALANPISADAVRPSAKPPESEVLDVEGPVPGAKESEMIHGIGTGSYSKKKEEGAVHGVGTGSYSKKEPEADGGKTFDSGPNKLKTSDAFYRDGARYVCNGCNAKYFTRGEVEACFAKH